MYSTLDSTMVGISARSYISVSSCRCWTSSNLKMYICRQRVVLGFQCEISVLQCPECQESCPKHQESISMTTTSRWLQTSQEQGRSSGETPDPSWEKHILPSKGERTPKLLWMWDMGLLSLLWSKPWKDPHQQNSSEVESQPWWITSRKSETDDERFQ